jgi:transposase-like protein
MIKTPKSLYRGHRFPAEVIAQAVWLYFRFPLSLRMVEDLLAARGIIVSHETVMITDKLGSYGAACARMRMTFEHRQHKGLNNRAENSHLQTRRRERIMKRFKSARNLQCFLSIHDPIANLHHLPRHSLSSTDYRSLRAEAMNVWREIADVSAVA